MDDSTNREPANPQVAVAEYVSDACETAVSIREAQAVAGWARGYLLDCEWQDADRETIEQASDLDCLRAAHRTLDGGLTVALDDVRRLADADLAAAQARADSLAASDREREQAPQDVYLPAMVHFASPVSDRELERLAVNREREAQGFAPIQPLARFDVSETTASGDIAYRHRSIEAPDITTAGRQAIASLEPGWRILAVRPLAAPLASFTAIYREPAKPSIFEQAVTAVSFDAALEIANREAQAHGLVVVALAAGNPQGFGASILAAQVEQAGSQDV